LVATSVISGGPEIADTVDDLVFFSIVASDIAERDSGWELP
jgi:hypothetical protein